MTNCFETCEPMCGLCTPKPEILFLTIIIGLVIFCFAYIIGKGGEKLKWVTQSDKH